MMYTRNGFTNFGKKRAKAHCENCGLENPSTDEGYTNCCNELVCYGDSRDRFGVPGNYVVSCCWAKAEMKYKQLGKEIPNGAYRIL